MSFQKQARLGGHETFYPRELWLYKGIYEQEFLTQVQFFKQENLHSAEYPTDYFGVGLNMTRSIRYWRRAFGLVEKIGQGESLSSFAKEILKRDPYFQEVPSLWLLHYNLVSREDSPSTWYWFFCESGLVSFRKESFINAYKSWLFENYNRNFSEKSIENDWNVLVNMYAFDEKKDLFYPSPFLKLKILEYNSILGRYVKNTELNLEPSIFFYILFQFKEKYFPSALSIDLDYLSKISNSPFKVFSWSVEKVFETFELLSEKLQKNIKLSRTSGTKIITYQNLNREEFLDEIYNQKELLVG